ERWLRAVARAMRFTVARSRGEDRPGSEVQARLSKYRASNGTAHGTQDPALAITGIWMPKIPEIRLPMEQYVKRHILRIGTGRIQGRGWPNANNTCYGRLSSAQRLRPKALAPINLNLKTWRVPICVSLNKRNATLQLWSASNRQVNLGSKPRERSPKKLTET